MEISVEKEVVEEVIDRQNLKGSFSNTRCAL